MARRNLQSIDLDESEPVTYKGNFPNQLSDQELMDELDKMRGTTGSIVVGGSEINHTKDPSMRAIDGMLGSPSDSQFEPLPNRVANKPDFKDADPKSKPPGDDIEQLLAQLDKAQGEQKSRSRQSRASAYALNAGEVVRAGFLGEKPNLVDVPAKYDVAAGAEKKLELGDKLKNSKSHWENEQKDRELKDLLAKESNTSHEKIAGANNQSRQTIAGGRIERDINKTNQTEAGKKERNEAQIKAGIGREGMKINASAGSSGGRADAQYANNQAERQVAGWTDTGAHTATDETYGSKIGGSEASVQKIGREVIEGMRKNGRNFPGSTEWRKLESSMGLLHEDLNKLHEEGVMNFGDKGNRIVESGDPQSFSQWILDQGPDILEHALDNIAKTTDARMGSHKYKRDPNWQPKRPSDYMGESSGGSRKAGVDPNVAPSVADWALGKGPAPKYNNPANDVKAPASGLPERKDSGQKRFKTVKGPDGNWTTIEVK